MEISRIQVAGYERPSIEQRIERCGPAPEAPERETINEGTSVFSFFFSWFPPLRALRRQLDYPILVNSMKVNAGMFIYGREFHCQDLDQLLAGGEVLII